MKKTFVLVFKKYRSRFAWTIIDINFFYCCSFLWHLLFKKKSILKVKMWQKLLHSCFFFDQKTEYPIPQKLPHLGRMFTVFRTKNRHVLGGNFPVLNYVLGTWHRNFVVGRWLAQKKRNRKESYPKHGKSEAYPIAQTYSNPTKIITIK